MNAKFESNIRKEQIINASAEIISRLGARGLSITNIAKAVGIVPSAIYRHFENKYEILIEIINVFSHQLNQLCEKATQQEVNPLSRIKKILNMHVQLLIQNRFFPILMFSEEVVLDEADIKKNFKLTINKFLGQIAANFAEAKKQNLIRKDISDQNLTMMYMGMFLPIAASLVILGHEAEVISQVEANWIVFQNGVLPR